MFERFTDRARKVIVLTTEDCRKLQNPEIVPAHIVLGILREASGLGGRALLSTGLSYSDAYYIAGAIERADEPHPFPGKVPFSKGATKLIELSLREALQLGHNYIGTEHLLLAWIRLQERSDYNEFSDEASTQILAKTSKTPQELRSLVIEVISKYNPYNGAKVTLQLSHQEDFSTEVEIPYILQEDFIIKNRRLVSFLATSGKGSDIDPSLSAIVAKLGHMQVKVSMQQSEMLEFCTWYVQALSHLVPSGHPFQKLYELFMSALHPGLYG